MSLVRVRFVKDHGEFTEGYELSVDPASAASLVDRKLAVLSEDVPAPADDPEDEPDDEIQTPDADDDPDTGDVTLPIPD
ncbi:hypothetical protein SEA_WIDOW_12 [Gordonia phage Widow]|nr:hypothetical protein SEA_WIDOW_12 [Gordonia phage Widow]